MKVIKHGKMETWRQWKGDITCRHCEARLEISFVDLKKRTVSVPVPEGTMIHRMVPMVICTCPECKHEVKLEEKDIPKPTWDLIPQEHYNGPFSEL